MTVISPPPNRQKFFDDNGELNREWMQHFESIHKRTPLISVTSTGTVAGGSRKDVTVNWQPAFKDLNYSLSALMEDTSLAGDGLRVERIRQKNLGNVIVQVINDSASTLTGNIHLTAVHD